MIKDLHQLLGRLEHNSVALSYMVTHEETLQYLQSIVQNIDSIRESIKVIEKNDPELYRVYSHRIRGAGSVVLLGFQCIQTYAASDEVRQLVAESLLIAKQAQILLIDFVEGYRVNPSDNSVIKQS